MLFSTRIFVFLGIAGLAFACNKEKSSSDVNTPPIADAGGSQSLSADEPVLLSGTGSFDPDGDPLSYTWAFDSLPDGSSMGSTSFSINDSTDTNTTFSPDTIGTYVVQLVVTDSRGAESPPDWTLIEVEGGETPTADAGENQSGLTGATVTVDGANSTDPLERALTYSWTFAKVPDASTLSTVDAADSVAASFTPDVSGMYIVALTVNNGMTSSSPDTAVIRVSAEDAAPPIAIAGADKSGEDCTNIKVNGSGSSDPDGEPLSYFWDVQSVPPASTTSAANFENREAMKTTFMPDVAGEYILSLAVFDGTSWSTPDHITLTIEERSYNGVPTVYPGATQTHDAGEAICEEIGYSYICAYCDPVGIVLGRDAVIRDADDDATTVLWEVISGSANVNEHTILITEATMTSAQPVEPDACETTDYTFQLTATDCTGASASQTVVHQAVCCGITSGGGGSDSATDDSGAETPGDGTSGEGSGGDAPEPTPAK
jgi:hypothetical protein